MGRYVSGGSGSQPRRLIVQVPVSNPSIPVPIWAQGGKGIVHVTGCGAGASGGVGTNGLEARGGAAGAFAKDHPIVIPAGVATLAAVIGAGGAPVTASVLTAGNLGGDTTLTVGAKILRLNGAGNGYSPDLGGIPTCSEGGAYVASNYGPSLGFIGGGGNGAPTAGYAAPASSLGVGNNAGNGSQGGSYANGAISPWGAPTSFRQNSPATGNAPAATGHGAGGTGAVTSGVAVTSGAGAPGFLTLEFIEGF